MLIIRSEQMAAFNQHRLRVFEDRMVDYVSKTFPADFASKGERVVRQTISNGTERSKSYGITAEYDVARYIDLMFRICEEFDSEDWAAYILENQNLSAKIKMDRLCEITNNDENDHLRE